MRLRHALATLVGAALVAGLPASGALAQDYPGGQTEERVLNEGTDRPDSGSGAVLGETVSRPEVLGNTATRGEVAGTRQTLPVTGGDLAGLAILGVSLVGAGTVVVRRSRRTAVPAA